MTMPATAALRDRSPVLQRQLRARLTAAAGAPEHVIRIERRPCPYRSSFQIDELDVHLTDGRTLALVLKHLGREGMLAEARRARPRFLESPRREVNAYRHVLPLAPPGTAALFGAVESSVRAGQLLLERVEGEQLWQVGDLTVWEATAAWIARFHATFSPLRAQQLAKRCGALVYDASYYRRWATRARRFAAQHSDRLRALTPILETHRRATRRLLARPRTLIHGELYASNVLVQPATLRTCPVDWELIALAPALMDLAALTAGFGKEKQRRLERAYQGASTGAHGESKADDDFTVDLDCCRLHLAVRMLGWSNRWEAPKDHAFNWLREAKRLVERLRGI